MTITLSSWFRDFFADFLQKEPNEDLQRMGKRFSDTFTQNTWNTGQAYFVLDFLDGEVAAITASDGWQRMYDHMKVLRKDSQKQGKHLTVMYNYITQRMKEFLGLVRKLTGGTVIIKTDARRKKTVEQAQSVLLQDVIPRPQGCIPENYERHKEAAQRALDELQACIVLAGGRKLSIQELANMTLAEALFLCIPNHINLKATQAQLPRTGPLYT